MITLDQHIEELRREINGCGFTRRERAAVKAQLAKTLAERDARIAHSTEPLKPSTRRATRPGRVSGGQASEILHPVDPPLSQ